jgi:hypothetical protein
MFHDKRSAGQWGTAKRYSVFSQRPYEFTPGKHHYTKILLTEYCKQKGITRKIATRLINKKWLAVTRLKGRLFVHEICPDLIDGELTLKAWRRCGRSSP